MTEGRSLIDFNITAYSWVLSVWTRAEHDFGRKGNVGASFRFFRIYIRAVAAGYDIHPSNVPMCHTSNIPRWMFCFVVPHKTGPHARMERFYTVLGDDGTFYAEAVDVRFLSTETECLVQG
ncbi:hypothetical protein JTB14_030503 [Gonioctena quinquepunctata]|nr:hypothetical protein JTB14_030503 [Gonioctena quinquepunctata]